MRLLFAITVLHSHDLALNYNKLGSRFSVLRPLRSYWDIQYNCLSVRHTLKWRFLERSCILILWVSPVTQVSSRSDCWRYKGDMTFSPHAALSSFRKTCISLLIFPPAYICKTLPKLQDGPYLEIGWVQVLVSHQKEWNRAICGMDGPGEVEMK